MQRYFAQLIDNKISLTQGDVHHLLHVMRSKVGDEFILVYSSQTRKCKIDCLSPFSFSVVSIIEENKELDNKITLFFALAKGDKIDFVIQKATELGVSRIVLIKTKRDVVKLSQDDFLRKLSRFQIIAKEASEQCHRNTIPEILGIEDISSINKDYLCDVNYVAYEALSASKPNFETIKANESLSILIGSEGGLEEKEVSSLIEKGFKPVSLGKRILRTETAAIYALSVLSYLIESK